MMHSKPWHVETAASYPITPLREFSVRIRPVASPQPTERGCVADQPQQRILSSQHPHLIRTPIDPFTSLRLVRGTQSRSEPKRLAGPR